MYSSFSSRIDTNSACSVSIVRCMGAIVTSSCSRKGLNAAPMAAAMMFANSEQLARDGPGTWLGTVWAITGTIGVRLQKYASEKQLLWKPMTRVQPELRLESLKRPKLELSRPCRFSLFHRHVAKNLQQFQPTTSDNWIL